MCTQGGRESQFAYTFEKEFEILQRLQALLENVCLGLVLGLVVLSVTAACVLLTFCPFLLNCCFLDFVNTREVRFVFLGYGMQKFYSVYSDH